MAEMDMMSAGDESSASLSAMGDLDGSMDGSMDTAETETRQEQVNFQLIKLVEERPVLWDHKLAFEEKAVRDVEWENILDFIKCESLPDVDSVERRWKAIRDRYARERKKLQGTVGRLSTWSCWERLEFLKDTVRSRKRSTARMRETNAQHSKHNTRQNSRAANRRSMHQVHQTRMYMGSKPTLKPGVQRKYFQVSFPTGSSQMKSEPVSMESEMAGSTGASLGQIVSCKVPTSSGGRVYAKRGRPPKSSSATVQCLTSPLSSRNAGVLAAASPGEHEQGDVMVLVDVDETGTHRVHHMTSPAQRAAQENGQIRSAFMVPSEIQSPARPRAERVSYSPPAANSNSNTNGGSANASAPSINRKDNSFQQQQSRLADIDSEALFGAHVSATLRRLPPRARAQLQLNIEQCIVDVMPNDD